MKKRGWNLKTKRATRSRLNILKSHFHLLKMKATTSIVVL